MGRDISVVCENDASISTAIRAILGTESRVDTSKPEIRFGVLARKVFLFDRETEERVYFEGDGHEKQDK